MDLYEFSTDRGLIARKSVPHRADAALGEVAATGVLWSKSEISGQLSGTRHDEIVVLG